MFLLTANADKNRIKISMVDPKNDKGTVPVTLYNGSTPGTYEITKHTITSPDPLNIVTQLLRSLVGGMCGPQLWRMVS